MGETAEKLCAICHKGEPENGLVVCYECMGLKSEKEEGMQDQEVQKAKELVREQKRLERIGKAGERGKKVGECESCHTEDVIHGRGLCVGCYSKAKASGTLPPTKGYGPRAPKAKKPEACRDVPAPVAPEKPARELLTLDLTAYPKLAEHIKEVARNEFRTPDMQALYWLHTYFGENDAA